jgi:sodium transport system permease protein
MVAVVPNIELTSALAAAPVAGAVLLFRDLLLAQGEPEMLGKVLPAIPVVLGTTVLAAGLSLRWAVWMFSREEVLFRDPGEPFSWKDLRAARRPGSVPGPGAAVFLPAAALAATFVLGQFLLSPADLAKPWAILLQQGILVAAVAAGVGVAGLDVRATLGLRSPGAASLGAGLLLGVGAAFATPWLTRALGLVPEAGGTAEILKALVGGLSPVALVLLLGVLPAAAEEALFRGWCLRGFRSEMGAFAAIALSSVLFGAFHLEPERIAFTAAFGLGLGLLALRSGSILPSVLAHALHNGITVAFAKATFDLPESTPVEAYPFAARVLDGASAGIGLAGLAAVAAGIALIVLARRRDSLPPAARGG